MDIFCCCCYLSILIYPQIVKFLPRGRENGFLLDLSPGCLNILLETFHCSHLNACCQLNVAGKCGNTKMEVGPKAGEFFLFGIFVHTCACMCADTVTGSWLTPPSIGDMRASLASLKQISISTQQNLLCFLSFLTRILRFIVTMDLM